MIGIGLYEVYRPISSIPVSYHSGRAPNVGPPAIESLVVLRKAGTSTSNSRNTSINHTRRCHAPYLYTTHPHTHTHTPADTRLHSRPIQKTWRLGQLFFRRRDHFSLFFFKKAICALLPHKAHFLRSSSSQ